VTTDLLIEYRKHREQGHGHHAALKALARRFNFDPATVGRVVTRAEREESMEQLVASESGASAPLLSKESNV
jgi:hypothetical protein